MIPDRTIESGTPSTDGRRTSVEVRTTMTPSTSGILRRQHCSSVDRVTASEYEGWCLDNREDGFRIIAGHQALERSATDKARPRLIATADKAHGALATYLALPRGRAAHISD